MTIIYTCTIEATKDLTKAYEIHTVQVRAEHCIPDNTLRKIVIDKLPREYIKFGHLTIDPRLEKKDGD